jgi:putative phage-type endonuclease
VSEDPTGSATGIAEVPALDQEKRALGVSASEIAAILGESEYQDAFTVYMRKIGDLKEDPAAASKNIPLRMGRVQETELLNIYKEITGKTIIRPGTLSHPDRPWQVATPDALVVNEPRGVECKTTSFRLAHEWGDPEIPEEADRVPTECFLQCQYGMSVTRSEDWDVPALIGGEFGLYHIAFDKELEEMMIEGAREFIEKHLIPRIPPPIGWSAGSSAWVKKKYNHSSRSPMISASTEQLDLVTRLYALKKIEKALTRELNGTINRLKLDIGEQEGMRGVGWEVRWKKNRDGTKTDWQQVARWVAQRYDVPKDDFLQAVQTFTERKEGNRPFGPHKLPDRIFYRMLKEGYPKAMAALDEGFKGIEKGEGEEDE